MSAFIVQFSSINLIATFIYGLTNDPPLYLSKPLLNSCSAKELARQMFELNVAAIEYHYGKGSDLIPKKPFEYVATEDEDLDPVQVLKSLDCFLYQCDEGDIGRKRLFRTLQAFSKELGHALMQESEEYAKTKWG